MSKRSHRFRATVEVPELGPVEVRGLSPDALAALALDTPTEAEIAVADASATPHPAVIAIIAAACLRPRLTEAQIAQLPRPSLDKLRDAAMTAHPETRRMYAKQRGDH